MRSHVQPCTEGVLLSPRFVVFAKSGSGEAFGDCFVSSMVCRLSFIPDGNRYSRPVVLCGKGVLKDLINAVTGR